MTLVLGVDAGNSKTVAMVAGFDGSILGYGRSGCGDIYGVGEQLALDAIAAAAHEAMRAAGVAGVGEIELASVVLSAAGADWPEDFDTIRDGAIARGLGRNPIVFNDAIGGIRAGSPDGTGVVVVCGTGTAIGSRAGDGRLWHSSFWQGPQGATALGRSTLDAVVGAELGTTRRTALTAAVLQHFGTNTVEETLHLCTARSRTHPPLKPLAKVLFDVASTGDAVARDLVTTHGRALGDYALLAARKVNIDHAPFHLVLAGGVLRHSSPLMRDAIVMRVREASPDVNPITDGMEPVAGAVMLALEAAEVRITAAIQTRLRRTMPGHSLFET